MTNSTPPGGMEPENDINGGSPEEQLSPDELALRRLMRDAVSDIQPGHEALDHLRRAVPARRTHRRQLLAGSAAACLLALVAVPAALHAANISGSAKTGAANASSAQDNGGTDGGPDGPAAGAGTPTPTAGDGVPDEGPTRTSGSQAQVPPGSSDAVDPSDTLAANAPLCSSDDLGEASGYAGASDGAGRVSGWFQVANTSDRSCTVDGGGTVTFAAQGAAESARISVVDHTANDGTTLPDSLGTLILKAGQSYRVEFTWVPAAGGTGGCTPPSTPTPTATATDSPTGEASAPPAGDNGASQGAPAAIVLSHTPEAGAPVVNATIDGACAGTVYKTGAVAAQ
ncbi:hypothetical protein [Actinacidiphila glaucinigra]|uniref:hypothetical protein n=1 Tax=Actinacidiphila glaucinigra TaxID=235986 RepID=UPI0029B8FD0F|nr:hypothetical protein [Streptomyces sp. PA03-3a]